MLHVDSRSYQELPPKKLFKASSEPEMMQAANSASGKLAHHCPKPFKLQLDLGPCDKDYNECTKAAILTF